MVRYVEFSRKSVTGLELFSVKYLPAGQPRAALLFHHGVGEHIGRYQAAFTSLADDHSIAVYAADAVGHGKSGGTRAYIERFSDVVSDFEGLCTTASEELAATDHPKPPMFIGGHSLGGLVAALTCLQLPNQFAGLLLCSPAVDVEWTPVLRMQAAVGNLLASVVPKARIVPAVDPKNLNKDPKKVEEYLNDPLITAGPMASRTANETLKAFKLLGQRRSEFTLPIYAHHGTLDKITSMPATKAFVEAVPSSDKIFVPLENGYHEVLLEDEGPAILEGMGQWILARAGNEAKM